MPKHLLRALCAVLPSTASALWAGNDPLSPKLHAVLQLKPGLWEFIDKPTVTGETIVFPATLLKIPLSQRAAYVAQLRDMMAQPTRERECISQAIFEQRLFMAEAGCKQTIVSNAANKLEVQTECRDESGDVKQVTHRKVFASSPTKVIVSFHAVTTQQGKTMTVDSTSTGQLLRPNCGDVHTIQIMP